MAKFYVEITSIWNKSGGGFLNGKLQEVTANVSYSIYEVGTDKFVTNDCIRCDFPPDAPFVVFHEAEQLDGDISRFFPELQEEKQQ